MEGSRKWWKERNKMEDNAHTRQLSHPCDNLLISMCKIWPEYFFILFYSFVLSYISFEDSWTWKNESQNEEKYVFINVPLFQSKSLKPALTLFDTVSRGWHMAPLSISWHFGDMVWKVKVFWAKFYKFPVSEVSE